MKTILASFLIILLLLPISAIGEIQTVTHTIKQPFGGSQSPDDARIAAVAKAKREALEIAGTYIESLTVVKNSRVDKDEIIALAAGVLNAEVVSQKNYASEEAFGIEVVVNVIVDTSVLEERVKKLLQDRTHLEQLNQARKKEKELLDKVVKLEEENRRLMAQNKSSKDLKKQFEETSQGLTAVDWVRKALALWVNGEYTDPRKAIEYQNEAIHLKPDFAMAYIGRGVAYDSLGQYQRAIKDYDKAIRLKSGNAEAYVNRGAAYAHLKQYQRAIKDFDAAIRLNPDLAMAYGNRGAAYANLNQYERAIKDFDEAIRLKPDLADIYSHRGSAYLLSGNKSAGCQSLSKACELGKCERYELVKQKGYCQTEWVSRMSALVNTKDWQGMLDWCRKWTESEPKNATAWYFVGFAYGKLKRYDDAVEAYRQAIRINPEDHGPWFSLGFTYCYEFKRYDDAVEAYRQAIRINPNDAASWFQIGIIYILTDNRTAALEVVQKLRRLDPAMADKLFNVVVPR